MDKVEMTEKREIHAKLPAKRHKHNTKTNIIIYTETNAEKYRAKKNTTHILNYNEIIYYSCNNEW